MAHNEKVFAMAGYSLNVQPELTLSKDLMPIALPSSPAIANTPVRRMFISDRK
jgi:hypothetical protein